MASQKSDYVSDVWKDSIFNGRVVFATGASGTICSAQVKALVHLGANACIVGRNKEKAERVAKEIEGCRSGSRVIGIGNVDVRKMDSLQAAVDVCAKELGGIDYVIAGAAGNFLSSIDNLSPNAMRSVLEIDVLGSYHTLKATLPYLLKSAASPSPFSSPTGRIIFISATLHYTGLPLQSHVSVAKAGVDALSASVAIEYGPRGITSNIIAPGPIENTEGMARLSPKEFGGKVEEGTNVAKGVPLQRWGKVKEIADATVYLFADTGDYVNGAVVVVDGGAWRMQSTNPGAFLEYPDFLISGKEIEGVEGRKKAKL